MEYFNLWPKKISTLVVNWDLRNIKTNFVNAWNTKPTLPLHMKWQAKIGILKQRDFKIQKKLVAWKSLTKAIN